VPPNTAATVETPDGRLREVMAGEHLFKMTGEKVERIEME